MTDLLRGRRFWKMSGSGNDFVFFDNRAREHDDLADPGPIGRICDRRSGIGADGIVLLDPHPVHHFGMRYYNRDGSLAEMCGNAALCSTRLAGELGIVPVSPDAPFTFETSSGPVTARLGELGPEIEMVPVTELQEEFSTPTEATESHVGSVRVGVPHLVLLCDDAEAIDLARRGSFLRRLPQLPTGSNVNFVSRSPTGWRMRTYERGVEQETMACGTGAVAVAVLLNAWGLANGAVPLMTRPGRWLHAVPPLAGRPPRLHGEGRIVFTGVIDNL